MNNRLLGAVCGANFCCYFLHILRRSTVFKKARTNPAALFVISLVVNLGMWLERYVIVVVSLPQGLICALILEHVTRARFGTGRRYVGTIGLFLSLLFLFIRFLR